MKAFLKILFFFFLFRISLAQESPIIVGKSYFGSTIDEEEICDWVAFTSRPEVSMAVESIVRRSGLKQNFYVMECPNTQNCFAATKNGERLIVYDARFFEKLNTLSKSNWAALNILAHEIGHHLQGHTIKSGGSEHSKELEADEFSGFVMYQMGASLSEAQAAIGSITPEFTTSSHPARSVRLKAIEKGYSNAKALYPNIKSELIDLSPSKKSGCISGNCVSGKGTAINSKTAERYEGAWHLGKRHGYGKEFSKDGKLKYSGGFINGKYDGRGILYLENGDRYEGGFYKGKFHGKISRYIFKNGNVLVSAYNNGIPQGNGILSYKSGGSQSVHFKNGLIYR